MIAKSEVVAETFLNVIGTERTARTDGEVNGRSPPLPFFSFFFPSPREIRAREGRGELKRVYLDARQGHGGTYAGQNQPRASKMSGRLPRLRALRPRPPQTKTEPRREGNLKEDRGEAAMKGYVPRDDTEEVTDGADDGLARDEPKYEPDDLLDCSGTSQGYECKTCKPSKPMVSLKAYLDHLKKEHKQKVYISELNGRILACGRHWSSFFFALRKSTIVSFVVTMVL